MRAARRPGPAKRSLTAEMLAHFEIDDVSRLPRIVYDREQPRMAVAALGPLVQHVSEQGDAVATRILERAAEEIGAGGAFGDSPARDAWRCVRFLLAGGMFRVVPWLAEELPRRLVEVAPRAQVELLERNRPKARSGWLARKHAVRRRCRATRSR